MSQWVLAVQLSRDPQNQSKGHSRELSGLAGSGSQRKEDLQELRGQPTKRPVLNKWEGEGGHLRLSSDLHTGYSGTREAEAGWSLPVLSQQGLYTKSLSQKKKKKVCL